MACIFAYFAKPYVKNRLHIDRLSTIKGFNIGSPQYRYISMILKKVHGLFFPMAYLALQQS